MRKKRLPHSIKDLDHDALYVCGLLPTPSKNAPTQHAIRETSPRDNARGQFPLAWIETLLDEPKVVMEPFPAPAVLSIDGVPPALRAPSLLAARLSELGVNAEPEVQGVTPDHVRTWGEVAQVSVRLPAAVKVLLQLKDRTLEPGCSPVHVRQLQDVVRCDLPGNSLLIFPES